MLYLAGAVTALVALVVGWAFGAVWASKKTGKCAPCGADRTCPKCGTMALIA